MKLEKNNKYLTIAIYSFLVIAASIILIFSFIFPERVLGIFTFTMNMLLPVILGFAIAFILNPLVNLFENKVFSKLFKKAKKGSLRALSLVATYIIFLGLIAAFLTIVVPSIIESFTDLINNLQHYYNSGIKILKDLLEKYNIDPSVLESFDDLGSQLVSYIVSTMKSIMPALYGITMSVTGVVKNIFVGFAFSIYMLSSKEIFAGQVNRLLTIFTKPITKERVLFVGRLANNTFSKYITGYILDSTIVGIICYIVMRLFGWPYPELISLTIGVTNMIPFFGPFIGGVPSALLIMLVNPWQALFFIIFIVVLQQIDGNFICPRVLGQQVGLSPFWVITAIIVGGSLFGIVGMLIGVPTFAVIYSIAKMYIARKERQKGIITEKEKPENEA